MSTYISPDPTAPIRRHPAAPASKPRDEIIKRHEGLVRAVAHKFVRPGIPLEDLVQTAWIALIRALDRFDPEAGTQFTTYAVTCMTGEIKRYFRDRTWTLKMPRGLHDLVVRVPRVRAELESRLQRPPTMPELAEALGVTPEDLIEAMEAGRSYQPVDLDEPRINRDGSANSTLGDTLGRCDPAIEAVTERAPMAAAIATLDERDQRVICRRFFDGWTQAQVAKELALSQMHVCRLERAAIAKLRHALSLP